MISTAWSSISCYRIIKSRTIRRKGDCSSSGSPTARAAGFSWVATVFWGGRSFGSLIYTAVKLKQLRRARERREDASANLCRVPWRTRTRRKATKERKAGHCIYRAGKSRGTLTWKDEEQRVVPQRKRRDYIVIREECWLDPSVGRVRAPPSFSLDLLPLKTFFPPLRLSDPNSDSCSRSCTISGSPREFITYVYILFLSL